MRILLILIVFAFVFASSARAVVDPKSFPNNKFGIHIIDESDLDSAFALVNSSGGDWGYVTIVIREDERNYERWQGVFNQMRRKHLIPIVRIATKQTSDGWEAPSHDEIGNWVNFLSSLNWVVQNRYVIIGNEPNHTLEWGGNVEPKEYANYLKEFSSKLKSVSSDFFVLPAGLDASAPNGRTTMSEVDFIKDMLDAEPQIFQEVDGWVSHSYPTVEVSIERQSGRGSLKTYEWELSLLQSLGVNANFPVFITETGWRLEGGRSEEMIGENLKKAYEEVWKGERIVAVTPFLLNYKSDPFLPFSWTKPDGTLYKFYYDMQRVPKVKGEPAQITNGKITNVITMPFVQANYHVYGFLVAENTGQSIWESGELDIKEGELLSQPYLEPFEGVTLGFRYLAPNMFGYYANKLELTRNGATFGEPSVFVTTVVKIPTTGELLIELRDAIW